MTVTGAPNETKIMGEKIPSSYLSLARMIAKHQFEMQEQNKIPILRKSQFEALVKENAKKNPRDIFDPDDVDNATRFLHDIGECLNLRLTCVSWKGKKRPYSQKEAIFPKGAIFPVGVW